VLVVVGVNPTAASVASLSQNGLEVIHSNCTKNVATAVSVHHTSVFALLTCGIVFQLIVLSFLLLLHSNRQLNRLILVSFYSAMTTELVLAELLCCDCECVFCNSLAFYVSAFYFILWAVVSAGYPALLSVVRIYACLH